MNWLSAESIISGFGHWAIWGVAIMIFLETSTIFGSILPGDSLLFLLGLSLGTEVVEFNLATGLVILIVAAIAGSQVGYWFGKSVGRKYFLSRNGWILNPKNVARTEALFEKYGARAIILARFVPILRALVPMFAGIGNLPAKRYFLLNVISAIAWAGGVTALGASLGTVEWVARNFEFCVIMFVVISSVPLPIEIIRHWVARKAASKTNSL